MNRKKQNARPPFARKRFGQHFLTEPLVVEQIMAAADVQPQDHIIEIGPGRGALTLPLAETGAELTVVELDRDLAEMLRHRFSGNGAVRVVTGDILKTDWTDLVRPGKRNKVVANLPYNISTPIFFLMTANRHLLDSAVLMVQKELALRLQHDGTGRKLGDYGILSVVAGNCFAVGTVCQVAPGSFAPPPKVNSTVIRLVPKNMSLAEEAPFFGFVRKAFNNRRKLFVSFLKREYREIYGALSEREQQHLGGIRPENLLPGQYLNLFQGKPFLE